MTDTWPAVFYNKQILDEGDIADVIETPVGTSFLIDFISVVSNLPNTSIEEQVTFVMSVNGVQLFLLNLTGTTFFGAGALELPVQGYVIPPGAFLRFETVWESGAFPELYISLHIAGRVTASPVYVGIFETA